MKQPHHHHHHTIYRCPPLDARVSIHDIFADPAIKTTEDTLQMGCVTAGEYAKMRRFVYFLYINSNLNEGPSYTDHKMSGRK
jgi:hypothetical protein